MKQTFSIILISLVSTLFYNCSTNQPTTVKTIIKEKVDTVYINQPNDKPIVADLKDYTINQDHFPSIGKDFRIKYIIVHYTALDDVTSTRVLTKQQVSSHYLVPEAHSDEIFLFVDENHRAWHAGRSYWKGRTNLNDSSIGIEISNLGYFIEDEKMYFIPFEDKQIDKVAVLIKDIMKRYGIPPENVIGHSDVAPQRKEDPGAMFPWEKLYREHNIGAWYDAGTVQYYISQFPKNQINQKEFILSVQQDLNDFGYESNLSGEWDKETIRLLSRFQMHFRPTNYSGELDAETWAIIKALNKKYVD